MRARKYFFGGGSLPLVLSTLLTACGSSTIPPSGTTPEVAPAGASSGSESAETACVKGEPNEEGLVTIQRPGKPWTVISPSTAVTQCAEQNMILWPEEGFTIWMNQFPPSNSGIEAGLDSLMAGVVDNWKSRHPDLTAPDVDSLMLGDEEDLPTRCVALPEPEKQSIRLMCVSSLGLEDGSSVVETLALGLDPNDYAQNRKDVWDAMHTLATQWWVEGPQ